MIHTPLVAACAVAICTLAAAQDYVFIVDTASSSIDAETAITAPIVGSLIGNYDAKTNPDGTRTLPGLFGGSGNQPVPYTADLAAEGESSTQPAGGYALGIDIAAGAAHISGLALDILNGDTTGLDATLSMTFGNFRTFNPDSVYFAVSNFPIPLGQFTITTLTVDQTADAAGTLTQTGPDEFTFAIAVPVLITIAGEFNGQPIAPAPLAMDIALFGTLDTAAEPTASIAFSVSIDETDEGPFEPFTDIPLDVPTILPPGETAHLLLSGEVQSIHIDFAMTGNVLATGELIEQPVLGDLNGDGHVDVQDLLILLGSWGPCPPPEKGDCPADIDGSGAVDVQDLLILLANWG